MTSGPSPLTRWFAPGRVNLIGEHTDYNGGFALPFAIEQGCRVTVTATAQPIIEIRSAQKRTIARLEAADLRPGAAWLTGPYRWAGYVAGAAWALGGDGAGIGLRLVVDGDIPIGAGLSSSAALCCAAVGALAHHLEFALSGAELAEFARRAESRFVGAPTGGMDQLASALATADHAVFCDMGAGRTDLVPLELDRAGLALLVVDTGHDHSNVDGQYARRRAECQAAADALGLPSLREAGLADLDRIPSELLRRRARHVLTENTRVLAVVEQLRSGGPADIGHLLTASHVSMRDDFEITVAPVDLAVRTALDAGALGARMTGGGFGGSIIALVPAGAASAVAGLVGDAFAAAGLPRPQTFLARPGPGAHRESPSHSSSVTGLAPTPRQR